MMENLQLFWLLSCFLMMAASAYLRNWLAFGGWMFAAGLKGQILGLLAAG